MHFIILGLHKGHLVLAEEAFSPKEHLVFHNMTLHTIFVFIIFFLVARICPSWIRIRNPEPLTELNSEIEFRSATRIYMIYNMMIVPSYFVHDGTSLSLPHNRI
jgi:hypothetical protein